MKKTLFFAGILSICLNACSSALDSLPGVYSLDIQQGNIVDQEMVNQLKPRMNKRQVLYIMGSPMLRDVWHKSRWDYLYTERIGGEAQPSKRVILLFQGDELVGIQGSLKPGDLVINKQDKQATVLLPKRNFDKTLWQELISLFGFSEDAQSHTDPENLKPKANES